MMQWSLQQSKSITYANSIHLSNQDLHDRHIFFVMFWAIYLLSFYQFLDLTLHDLALHQQTMRIKEV